MVARLFTGLKDLVIRNFNYYFTRHDQIQTAQDNPDKKYNNDTEPEEVQFGYLKESCLDTMIADGEASMRKLGRL